MKGWTGVIGLALGVVCAGCVASGGGDATEDAALSIDSAVALDTGSAEDLGVSNDLSTPDVGEEETQSPDTHTPEEPFSFFVTSLEGMQELSGSVDGFGGDLGGLAGADEICRKLAENVDAGHKTWRAFLSVVEGPDGKPVHAIDRIGEGPWYDRNGRLVALSREDLMGDRPIGDAQIVDDLPNEYGQGQKQFGDNHDTLTGSNAEGQLNSEDPASTCMDWTSAVGPGSEKMVMAGHSWPREAKPGDGPDGDNGGGPKVPPPWTSACSGLSIGDACDVTKGKKKFTSTCAAHPDDETVVFCMPDGWDPNGGPGGGGGDNDGVHWVASHTVPGCAAGVQLNQEGGGDGTDYVGGAGGYGGIYCFALEP
jgi:hypothetical protein